ncbi:MAG TPA: DUF4332 domain-containing protein [Candidatus Eisenbacteria bacterium]|jgi:hypothetical protein|nr:DUF4332 domain-containing protein [Candidatus Eisenbacteria bacterium]
MLNYKMSDLKGIDETQVAQLLQGNVENTDEMMNLWNDQAGRLSITAKTGLTDEQIIRLASMARVARFKGVGPKYADLLVTAGVRGRKSLATYTPETLVQRLGEVKAGRSLAGPLPTLVEVGAWFAQLKPAVASDMATAKLV